MLFSPFGVIGNSGADRLQPDVNDLKIHLIPGPTFNWLGISKGLETSNKTTLG